MLPQLFTPIFIPSTLQPSIKRNNKKNHFGGWGGAIHAQTRIQEAHYIIDKQATQLFLATASQRGKDMTLKPHGLAMNFGFNVIKHGRQQHNMTILLKPINSIKIQLLAEIFFLKHYKHGRARMFLYRPTEKYNVYVQFIYIIICNMENSY